MNRLGDITAGTTQPPSPPLEELGRTLKSEMTALLPEAARVGVALTGSPLRSLLPDEAASLPAAAGPSRVNDFRLGRAAASAALRQLGFESVGVPRSPDGAPRWPEGVIGSISHANGLAIAAVASARQVAALGIDIETVPDYVAELLETEILTSAERVWSGSSGERIIQIFSAKEAVFKAVYPAVQRLVGHDEIELAVTGEGFQVKGISEDSALKLSLANLEVRSAVVQGWVLSCAVARQTTARRS